MSNVLRMMTLNAQRRAAAASRNPTIGQRAPFHSPFAALGSSPLASTSSNVHPSSSVYEKQVDVAPEPFSSQSGARVHVVSEQPSPNFYGVPSGAYPTSLPFGDASAQSSVETRKPAKH